MLSVSTTATWSHGGHPRQVRPVFSGLWWHIFSSIAFITQLPLWFAFASRGFCNLTRCLVGATHRTKRHKSLPTAFSRCAPGSAPSGTGGKRFNTPRSTGMRGIDGVPDLPLGGSSFHHPLAFRCRRVPTVPGRPHILVQPADVMLQTEAPPSLQAVLHERHMAPDKPLFVAQQTTTYLPRRHRLHHARAWPSGDPETGAVGVEGHVLRREPAVSAALSVPYNLLRKVAMLKLTEDDSEQGTRRRL